MTTATQPNIASAIRRKAEESTKVITGFFEANQNKIAELAHLMAERFEKGGRLFVMGNGGSSCDAEHLMVEFMHPIFEKRKPLPCLSLNQGHSLITAIANDEDFSRIFSHQLIQLAKPEDMVLVITTSGMSSNLVAGLKTAKSCGLMTIAFSGKDGGRVSQLADHVLTVPSFSIHRIQESHTVLLHVLWDAIHLTMGEQDIV
ncbi:MAG: SIS domain-containing protein [Candidatus Obscuribacterales bacterium]|nr:SIS domain-containing protein [Candidatus Obscuribacterales bacterium]